MLLAQLHDELSRAASAKPAVRRTSRAARALLAAMAALLVAAPAAHGELSASVATALPAALPQQVDR
jgi:hypothetical protein